jgi:hypothetical protein
MPTLLGWRNDHFFDEDISVASLLRGQKAAGAKAPERE